MFDILIQNGLICDGTGKPSYQADIGITGDKITYIGNSENKTAAKIIDAAGKIITPGFIDPHTHVDWSVLSEPAMEPYLKQGVTTVVTGNCGYSLAPQGTETLYYSDRNEAFLEEAGASDEDLNPVIFEKEKGAAALKHQFGIDLDWTTFEEFSAKCDSLPLGCNMAPLVGHSAVRTAVMGMDCKRKATEEEIAAMKAEVKAAMEAGAFGMSTGRDPLYLPGPYADDEEIRQLLKPVSDYDGVFASHTYNYNGGGEADRIGGYREMFRQAEGMKLKLQVSHVHVMGMAVDSESAVQATKDTLACFDEAKAAGVDLTYDVIPSPTCSDFTLDSFGYFIKPLVKKAGTLAQLAERLKEPEFFKETKQMIADGQLPALDAEGESAWLPEFTITRHKNPAYKGKMIPAIAKELGMEMADAMLTVLSEDPKTVADLVSPEFSASVDMLCARPEAMPCSDGASYAKETNLTGNPEIAVYPNSMNVGYIPRYLTRYGKGADGAFENAVRMASGFVAERFDIAGRGVICEGNFADLVIIDRAQLRSFDEEENPLQDPEGIDSVLVNGQIVLEDGKLAGNGAGRVLRKGEK